MPNIIIGKTGAFQKGFFNTDAQEGLIANYLLDGNGNDEENAEDLILNSASFESGFVGQAARFQGSGSNAYTQNIVIDTATLGFTMMGWVKVYGPGDNSYNRFIDLYATTGLFDGQALLFWDVDDDRYGFQVNDSGSSFALVTVNNDIGQNQYIHLTGVYDPLASNQVRFFENGTLQAAESISTFTVDEFALALGDNYFKANPSLSAGSNEDHVNAAIDEVRIYNRALSDLEVQSVYNSY